MLASYERFAVCLTDSLSPQHTSVAWSAASWRNWASSKFKIVGLNHRGFKAMLVLAVSQHAGTSWHSAYIYIYNMCFFVVMEPIYKRLTLFCVIAPHFEGVLVKKGVSFVLVLFLFNGYGLQPRSDGQPNSDGLQSKSKHPTYHPTVMILTSQATGCSHGVRRVLWNGQRRKQGASKVNSWKHSESVEKEEGKVPWWYGLTSNTWVRYI